jgi:hypothetical protein
MHHGFAHLRIEVEEIDWDKLINKAKGSRQRKRLHVLRGTDKSEEKGATEESATEAEANEGATPPPPPNEKKE